MKQLFLKSLLLLSHNERSARKIVFDKRATLLKGANDVGKSSIVKSIYRTFGAIPAYEHPKWKELNVVTLANFSVDGTDYSILRSRNSYGIFDSAAKLLHKFGSVTRGLTPFFADLFNFHLTLKTQDNEAGQAPPAFLFLPFYIDQDRGWTAPFESFERLKQFSAYRTDLVRFHVGIRPNSYYVAKNDKLAAEAQTEQEEANRQKLLYALRRMDELLDRPLFDVNLEVYSKEVAELLVECNSLRDRESEIKARLVEISNAKSAIETQISIAINAASELGKDLEFALNEKSDHIECPICGAHYENSFRERFDIAADEDQCRELLNHLKQEHEKLTEAYTAALNESKAASQDRQRVEEILTKKQGEVMLVDVLKSEGRKEVRQELNKDVDRINRVIGGLNQTISAAEEQMKKSTDAKRTNEIVGFYREKMDENVDFLGAITVIPEQYQKIDCVIKESGSDLPRALLAYYFAILATIHQNSSSTFCPIVIDSPRQQDQDDENWTKICRFIRDEQPEGSQLVLSLVDEGEVQFGGTVIELTDKLQSLQKSDYEKLSEELRPFFDQFLAADSAV